MTVTTAKPRKFKMRIRGSVPPDYDGPVYYRTSEDLHGPYAARRVFKLMESKERYEALYNGRNRGGRVLTSGLVVDEEGALLPQWRQPLKATLATDTPEREEFLFGDPVLRVSERVHDAIVSLEPDAHISIPVDATAPDGRVLRYYLMFIGKNVITDRPVLHPIRNALETFVYDSGRIGYSPPDWMRNHTEERRFHFGYLDANAIGDRHLFEGDRETDGARFFSSALMDKLMPFGHVFLKMYDIVPMGVDASPYVYGAVAQAPVADRSGKGGADAQTGGNLTGNLLRRLLFSGGRRS